MSTVEATVEAGSSWAARARRLLFAIAVLPTGTGLVMHLRHAGQQLRPGTLRVIHVEEGVVLATVLGTVTP
ncbi:MAG: hypothetical protein JF597_37520 [Streptomyces sp.]|uniref:hypothetical protein n=1 Tax=Streptomyces sp. TaxID=1931 RepID=UPI0025E34DB9|nr:hypothetical protein [Streptomyces sp.]MBW8799063.1 hypothetical protein [Streptomyces sp.]